MAGPFCVADQLPDARRERARVPDARLLRRIAKGQAHRPRQGRLRQRRPGLFSLLNKNPIFLELETTFSVFQ